MKDINALLERFKKSLGDDSYIKEEIIKGVEEKIKITLSSKEISLKNGVLEINTSPVKKNEIKLKEESLIKLLSKQKGLPINKIFYK
ncbi:MAG: hypothetical protein WAV25_01185 [Minisyncoccia bacterium]